MLTVADGANESAGEEEVRAALAGSPDVLVISAEVPLPAIQAALARARARAATAAAATAAGAARPLICLLNLAPVPAGAEELIEAGVDWLVVNETEASAVLGRPVTGLDQALTAAASLLIVGAGQAVVTAGPAGA